MKHANLLASMKKLSEGKLLLLNAQTNHVYDLLFKVGESGKR